MRALAFGLCIYVSFRDGGVFSSRMHASRDEPGREWALGERTVRAELSNMRGNVRIALEGPTSLAAIFHAERCKRAAEISKSVHCPFLQWRSAVPSTKQVAGTLAKALP